MTIEEIDAKAVPSPVLSEQKRAAHRQAREDFARGNFFQNDADLLSFLTSNLTYAFVAATTSTNDRTPLPASFRHGQTSGYA